MAAHHFDIHISLSGAHLNMFFNLISNFCVEIPIFNFGELSPKNYWKKMKAFYTWFFVQHVIIPIGITFRNVSIGRENIPPFVSNWAVTRARASCGACGTTTLALALVTAQLDTHGGICFPSLFRRIGMLYSVFVRKVYGQRLLIFTFENCPNFSEWIPSTARLAHHRKTRRLAAEGL